MRSFAAVFALLAASLLAAAVLAYPAWLLVGMISDQPIHRVMHRVAMLCALFGLIWLFRRWAMTDRQALGFGLPPGQFWRQLGLGLIAGTLIILPLIATLYALDLRVPRPGLELSLVIVLKLVAAGLITGLIVALIEEVFFRGLLFTAIQRESGKVLAIVLPSLLYASVHFLGGRLRVPAEQIDWTSGLAVLNKMFIKYADPLAIADSFLALFAVGALLALVRLRTRGIGACIGMHAAWVCVIAYVKDTTTLDTANSASWLVGSYDGVLGWAALGLMAVMATVYVALTRDKHAKSGGGLHNGEQQA